ncbi:response regulator transcription factor [Actinocrinis puniceicyclus]|uniref:Response regulator transcription factor n=1 Tax=Actinocrinis puniceicyclus TaxID=977794 RepID=A0A8J7WNC8_9ACTN|nr:response regulator transcription factor [Actinocrinis puniceicyclus]MBS2963297.1 response regulator transcription factor [Actinocrinis puniceicyclus]
MDSGSERPQIRVLVADDQAAVRDGLVTLLDLDPQITVVAAAGDGRQTLDAVAATDPDVVLMDLHMPVMDGIEATARITAQYPRTRVVVLTTYADDVSIHGALQAGALGYLTKDSGREDIARAVIAAAAGQSVLDGAVQRRLVSAAAAASSPVPMATAQSVSSRPDNLTAREIEVLRLIAAGSSNAQIAAQLFVSEATVKTHINHLFAKAGVRDRAQAVRYAYRHGLVG